ncbi:diguanylate cyclase domain-containing protein [Methylotenera sp. L2L1]|uniref:diguanylate cyclase domain-containing protein n=1 Tax=Methylotenera sp. L2L1 TaxID=1502770 RepID=UPI000A708757|nr:diguanylate cyclase [Methylotenera sp. L2L1]
MISPKVTIDELTRLQTLTDYQILDSAPEEVFDNLTKLASEICGTPISLITFVDSSRQWFKSSYGLASTETSRDVSFCGHAILDDALFEVRDAHQDERFKDNPLVTSDPHIRFYAGFPLTANNGSKLGTLCVIDNVPRKLDQSQRTSLKRIAKQVMSELEHRKVLLETADISKKLANSTIFYDALLNSADESIISTTPDGVITSFNQGAEKMLGYRADEMVGKSTPEIFHEHTEVIEYAKTLSHEFGETIEPGFEVFVLRAKRGYCDSRRWTYIRKDGLKITVNLSVTALIDDSGVLLGYMGVARDITSEIETQNSLRNLTSILEITGEMAKVGGWQLDLHNNQIKWTKEVFKIHELDTMAPPPLEQAIAFYPSEARATILAAVKDSIDNGSTWDLELPFITAKNKPLWVRSQGSPVMVDGRVVKLIGALQDITSRKKFELDLAWLNRALLMLSKANHAITQINDEKRLMIEICRIAVEMGGYGMAWVGYAEHDESKSISPQAFFGDSGKSYLETINLSWADDGSTHQGPAGKVIRTGKPYVAEDLLLDESFHFKVLAKQHGYRGLVVLPLKDRQETIGMLALYSTEVRRFSDGEVELLQELTDNLGTGISNIRAERQRQRLSDAMIKVAITVTSSISSDFFKKLVASMTETLGADAGYIAQLQSRKPLKASMLAVSVGQEFKENFEYDVPDAVAKTFFGDSDLIIIKNHADKDFPNLSLMRFHPFHAFAGLCLYDSKGNDIGLLFVFFKQAIQAQSEDLIKSILKIFAARTASELERLNDDLIIQEQASLLDRTNDAIVIHDMNLMVKYWNKGAEALYGWSSEEIVNHPIHKLLHQDQNILKNALEVLLEKGEWKGEVTERHKGGNKLIIESHWTLMRDANGKPKSIFSINSDITMRINAEEEVRKLAFYDALTALPNRRLLLDRIEQALSSARRKAQFGAVVFIDLDNFKQLNDTLGHDKGDALLQEVAQRLKKCVRDHDTVARLGGDEFVILVEDLSVELEQAKSYVEAIGQKILQALNNTFDFDGYLHTSTPSMGVAIFSKHTNSVDEVLKQADIAMYQSKNAGRNRLTFFSG